MLRVGLCLVAFGSAVLTFCLEPMVGRLLLPAYGGTALVWSSLLLFFQAALFVAYLVVHLAQRWLPWTYLAIGHLALTGWAATRLPAALGAPAPLWGSEALGILRQALLGVGLPFALLTAVCPLAMAGFAPLARRRRQEAFLLVAASNAGSLTGLLAYPLLWSPLAGLDAQQRGWAGGFAALAVGLAASWLGLALARRRAGGLRDTLPQPAAGLGDNNPPPGERTRWLALAALSSAWLSAATAAITLDTASGPLGWTLPLATYLATLTLAFARPRPSSLPAARRWLVLMLPVAALLANVGVGVGALGAAVHLLALAAGSWACHLALALARPPPARATDFLLTTAAGGAVGALACAWLAPALFDRVAEYPLVLGAACVWQLGGARRDRGTGGDLAVALVGAALGLAASSRGLPVWAGVALALAWQVGRGRPLWRLGMVTALAACGLRLAGQQEEGVEHRARSFYSALTIGRLAAAPHLRYEKSGTTLHGAQDTRPAHAREALGYYHADGPGGEIFSQLVRPDGRPIAVVGLGVGSLACAAAPGQTTTFFELDPLVIDIARDPRWFTHLENCPADVVVGDARQALARLEDGQLGTLVLDAYGSDAVPTHLLTREAMTLFWRVLAADGMWVGHLSHRNLDLLQPVACHAGEAGLHLAMRLDPAGDPGSGSRRWASQWAVVVKDPQRLAPLRGRPGWQLEPVPCRVRPWSDDQLSLWSVWRWKIPGG